MNLYRSKKKSFDAVNHELLLKKCEHCGLRGLLLQMLESYLKNRHQKIKIGKLKLKRKALNVESHKDQFLVHCFSLST